MWKGYETIVRYLVEHGADINKINKKGETPLSKAFDKGHENIIRYLVEHGAYINKKDKYKKLIRNYYNWLKNNIV